MAAGGGRSICVCSLYVLKHEVTLQSRHALQLVIQVRIKELQLVSALRQLRELQESSVLDLEEEALSMKTPADR